MQNLIKFIIKMAKLEQLIATQGLMDRFSVLLAIIIICIDLLVALLLFAKYFG